MIIKHWQKEEVRKELLGLGEKYANVIGTDINNWRSLWTHLGNGYWIGCWHPNGREPEPLRAIALDDQVYDVTEQFLPPEMTVEIVVNGHNGKQTMVPHIRIMKTEDWPSEHAELAAKNERSRAIDVIGHRQGELVGMTMLAWVESGGLEYEFAPVRNEHAALSPEGQEEFAQLESGESGGPSFGLDLYGEQSLQGIHRGGGGWIDVLDGRRWIAGVDTWLGHPQVNDWITSVIGVREVVPVQPDVVRVRVKCGQQIQIDWED